MDIFSIYVNKEFMYRDLEDSLFIYIDIKDELFSVFMSIDDAGCYEFNTTSTDIGRNIIVEYIKQRL